MLPWILVVIAGLFEVIWATSMKFTDGWTRLWPSVITLVAMLISFFLLARAMQSLPLGVAYTVWVGIGAIGAALAGWLYIGERLSGPQWLCIGLIAAGIAGLKLATPAGNPYRGSDAPATSTPA